MDGRRNQKRRKLRWGEVPFRLPPPLKPHERIVTRAFTVHLVYAWMQMHGLKTDEYRSFSPPVPAHGVCAIHISRHEGEYYRADYEGVREENLEEGGPVPPPYDEARKHAGKIIGVAEYFDMNYVEHGKLLTGWTLYNPVWLKRFIPVRGHLGMWELPHDVADNINAQLAAISKEKGEDVLARDGVQRRQCRDMIVDAIKDGRFYPPKDGVGKCLLEDDQFNAAVAGDLTEIRWNFDGEGLKNSIGVDSMVVRPSIYKLEQQPELLKFKIESVKFVDCDGNECDPFNVPDDFWPTTIAIHLGKRIG